MMKKELSYRPRVFSATDVREMAESKQRSPSVERKLSALRGRPVDSEKRKAIPLGRREAVVAADIAKAKKATSMPPRMERVRVADVARAKAQAETILRARRVMFRWEKAGPTPRVVILAPLAAIRPLVAELREKLEASHRPVVSARRSIRKERLAPRMRPLTQVLGAVEAVPRAGAALRGGGAGTGGGGEVVQVVVELVPAGQNAASEPDAKPGRADSPR